MKHLKMIGLAALAATALMALVGVGTASAKVCSTAGAGAACGGSHGSVYTGAISASLTSGKNAVLTSGFITVTCTESSAGGSASGGASSPATGNLTSLTFGGCTANTGGSCTAKSSASAGNPWPATLTTGTAPNGTMTVTNVTGEFTCTVFGSPVTCRYVATDAGGAGEIVVKGGTPAEIIATSVKLTKEEVSNGLCSNTATWSGEYKISTPTNAFLT